MLIWQVKGYWRSKERKGLGREGKGDNGVSLPVTAIHAPRLSAPEAALAS